MDSARTKRLAEFQEWTHTHIKGDEKGEAQIFLDRLFQAFGQRGCLEVGGHPEIRIRKSQQDGGGTAFADYVWKPVVLIEMKKRGADLSKHYRQAFDYWTRLVPGRPRYAVLCNFDEFWVYDFETQMDTPVDQVTLAELPERWGPLAFLFPTNEKPTFGNDHEAVTRKAADLLARCFNKLLIRRVPREEAQRFVLQMLVAFFAEDIGLLERYLVAGLLEDCKKPSDSYDLLGGLFEAMNTPGRAPGGRYKGVDYFNGGLFAKPVRIELYDDELNQLKEAARADWSKVRPEIFGTLFEHSLGQEERHAFGAHFTHPTDIMKIVGPTIVEPWRERIENAKSGDELGALLKRMQGFTVLDPACGSGNFLYIAYREIKRLEARLLERARELARKRYSTRPSLGFVKASNFYGMDINPFAVELAKVTMMIARKLAIDELHSTEEPLPLDNLDANFTAMDALIAPDGSPAAWPQADVIIGNPPFLDARKMTLAYGRSYVAKLESCYPDIARRADLCVYWFRKAHENLVPCTAKDPLTGRAGLVGTQNIRNNESREGGLDFIVKDGTILEAVDNQPWSGEANVHVSIANWAKTQDPKILPKTRRLWTKVDSTMAASAHGNLRRGGALSPPGNVQAQQREGAEALPYETRGLPVAPKRPAGRGKDSELAYRDVAFINSALSDETDVSQAKRLKCNVLPKVVFEGVQTGHDGFVISAGEATQLAAANSLHGQYIKPFINGSDLLSGKFASAPEYVIDMSTLDLLQASAIPSLLAIPQNRVLNDWRQDAEMEFKDSGRDRGEHQNRLDAWWALKRPRLDMQKKMGDLSRFIACSAVMKRSVFFFLSSSYLPTNALKVFAFADDYSFGILQSSAHWLWFVTKCSKLKSDFRYTPDSVFDTFPWPQAPTVAQIDAVAEAGREIRCIRTEALKSTKGGLRALYRTLELPGKNPLKDAHAALDAAVLTAYGFAPSGPGKGTDLLTQLLALNLEVARKIAANQPVTPPGLPATYPDPERLITQDCIQPPEASHTNT